MNCNQNDYKCLICDFGFVILDLIFIFKKITKMKNLNVLMIKINEGVIKNEKEVFKCWTRLIADKAINEYKV